MLIGTGKTSKIFDMKFSQKLLCTDMCVRNKSMLSSYNFVSRAPNFIELISNER